MQRIQPITGQGRALLFIAALLQLTACRAAPPANPSFNDAIQFAFRDFETEEPARLAFALRQLERELYLGVDIEASNNLNRSLTPAELSEDDLIGLEHPGRDVSTAQPLALATLSQHPIERHRQIPLLLDQRPVEPGSPDYYERSFLAGTEACWEQRGCEFLRTVNDLTKDNILLTITYTLPKDYRWIDLALPDPASEPSPDAQPAESRWAYIARSWTTDRAVDESNDRAIEQSYSFEIWLPRDGRGFLRDGSEANAGEGDWTSDSSGGGTLRMIALWAETEIGADLSEELVAYATRGGVDDIFTAQEDWLDQSLE
ncbi:MAG: hypothetical protein CMP23_04055 [Rickettsiales bacterium]|nr:hypothetical protein [Rickettsiales bacterium]